jgi:DNA-binding LytR/AlgR family response regulator
MNILIAEDEPLHADRYQMLAEQLGYSVIGAYANAFDALDAFHRSRPDLALLDIHLEGTIDGIQLAERFQSVYPSLPVIFVSSAQDDATFLRIQQARPAAFIIKPFSDIQLQRAVELAVSNVASTAQSFDTQDLMLPDCFFVKVGDRLEKIAFDDLLYIESDGRYSVLYTSESRKFFARIPMHDLEKKLPVSQFARTHRSFMVHLKWLKNIDLKDMIVTIKDKQIPLSKGFKDQILARLAQL